VPGFKWKDGSGPSAGTIALRRRMRVLRWGGPVLVLDFANYVQFLPPGNLLLWHQGRVSLPTAPVGLRVFRLSELRPIEGNIDALCESMRRVGAPFVASTAPACELYIPTTVAGERRQLVFPEQMSHVDELLILCHSSGVEPTGANLTLLVARPRDGTYELFPQDWYNYGDFDYGYEWVTRVARNPATDRIHGEGFRIAPFVLDETLRNRS
jgi:hypothetical protein